MKKPNRTETDKKPEPNRAKTGKNRAKTRKTEPNRFEPVLVFFSKKKYFGLVTYFDKNRTEPKMITPTKYVFVITSNNKI